MSKLFSLLASLILTIFIGAAAVPVRAAAVTNLVPNPSLEISASGQPTSWLQDSWGTNKPTFSYTTDAHTGSYSVTTTMHSYSSGDAKWYFAPVAISPNTSYTISDWYKSTAVSDLDIEITTTAGKATYFGLDELASSNNVWKQTNYTFKTPSNAAKLTVYHSIVANGQLTTDDFGVVDASSTPTPTPTPVPTAPTVDITAPTSGASLSGIAALSADTGNSQNVSSVQFKVDGSNVGAAVTAAPYSTNWDTKSVPNGTHTITAVATNSANLTATSSSVTVSVNNVTTPAPTPTPTPTSSNLIANPSFETAQDSSTPAAWEPVQWGNNATTFSYLNTGHTGNRSVEVQTTSYTDGAANWYYNEVPVTAGKTYQYINWYKSNVDTEVDAEVTMSDGTVQYFWLGSVFANTNWTQFKTTFTVPAGAKSVSVYQILAKVGYIVSDDYSLSEYTPLAYNRAIVSVTFDDGWQNQYQNAYPVLQRLGIKSTFYIISGEVNDTPDYMSGTQIKNLHANGHEIGSHSVTHPDMTTLGATRLKNQFANSQTSLQKLIGAPVTDFAYPYGAYNQNTINVGKQYYASQRSVNGGENTRDNLDVTQLKIEEVDNNITQAQVQAWINQAIADHAWLILVYHEVANTPAAPDDMQYTTMPSDFSAEMTYLKGSGVATLTVNQALAEVLAQQ